jgi:hypothetical protein
MVSSRRPTSAIKALTKQRTGVYPRVTAVKALTVPKTMQERTAGLTTNGVNPAEAEQRRSPPRQDRVAQEHDEVNEPCRA